MHTVLNTRGVWFSLMYNPNRYSDQQDPLLQVMTRTQRLRLLPFCGFTRINKDLWKVVTLFSPERERYEISCLSALVSRPSRGPSYFFSYFIGYNSVTWWYPTVGEAGKCSLLCVLEGEETGLVNSWPVFTTDSFNAILLFQQLNDLHYFASLQGDNRSYYL